MATELGKAYVQIVPSAQGISGSISGVLGDEAIGAGKKAGLNIAGGIGTALKGATGIMAAGTAAVSAALIKGAGDVAEYGDNIDKMSQKMGLSASAYQEWDAVMQHSGTSMETMKASMKTLANAAETGNKAFEALGISQEQLATMSQQDLFEATIAGLQNVTDDTQRTYLAGKLLGRGATELGALLNTSAEDTQAMRDRVRELGGVMSDDAVKAAAAFQDNMQDLKTAMSGLGRGLISEVLPGFNQVIEGFTSLVAGEEGAVDKLSTGFSALFTSLDGIMQNLVAKISEMLPSIIEGISTLLPQLINMASSLIISLSQAIITQLPTIVTTVIPALAKASLDIIVALGQALIQAAPALLEAGQQIVQMFTESFNGTDMLAKGSEMLQGVLDGITASLPGLLQSGTDIVMNLVNGLLNALPGLITAAGQLLNQYVQFLMRNYPTIMEAGANLLLKLTEGIVTHLPEIVAALVMVLGQLILTIAKNLPQFVVKGGEIIIKLIAGIAKQVGSLHAKIGEVIAGVVKAFADAAKGWLKIGTNIVQGIINGIKEGAKGLFRSIRELAENALQTAKDALGIASPSKEGAYLGKMFDSGIAKGVTGNLGVIDSAMDEASARTLDGFKVAANANYETTGNSGSVTFNNVFNINGTDRDPRELAEEISYYLEADRQRVAGVWA